jgi:hypothetical protein
MPVCTSILVGTSTFLHIIREYLRLHAKQDAEVVQWHHACWLWEVMLWISLSDCGVCMFLGG